MDVTPLVREGLQLIQSYSAEGFKINSQSYGGAVIVTPFETRSWNDVSDVSSLTLQNFQSVIEIKEDVDVVLFGTGAKMAFLPSEVQSALQKQGLNVDCMDTGAACRTFNILVAEGRRVVAMMLPSIKK